ncbi:MAG: hypothetical protein J0L52_11855 [Caulobacterales bacterium]|nr:hypothetical protein [Caulobacterales bacterium]
MTERNRLVVIAILALLTMGIAGVALLMEVEGGDGGRLGMFAGAPLIAALLLTFASGRSR